MILLPVLILFYIESAVAFPCDWSCPSDKPYCSEVGCIFECPEPFYINGSNCVSDCGEWFVDENRHCVASCPVNTVYKETLKQVMNSQYLERKCVNCDQPNQLVSDRSCVKVCPNDTRFIDKNMCVPTCPKERSFKINITIYGLLHYKCIEKCPQVEDNNFCREDCPENKVSFQSSCVEQCPSSHPFLFLKRCETKCPEHAPLAGYDEISCVNWECPEKRSFVDNQTCVAMCPSTAPYIVSSDRFNYCVKDCAGKYIFNDHCVSTCPSFTVAVNNTCLGQCPSKTPYSCVVTPGDKCGQRPRQQFQHSICIYSCPHTMLLWNKTCVFSCPSGRAVFGNECTDICPVDYPYMGNVTKPEEDCYQYAWGQYCQTVEKAVLTCLKECQANRYTFNDTCLSYCPYHLPQHDNTCVPKCPVSAPFVTNATVVIESWPYHSYKVKQTVQKCVSVCDDDMVILNHACVKTCPEDHSYIHNRTCSQQECETRYTEKGPSGIICTDECEPWQFVLDKMCVKTCPSTHMIYNGTCVDHCPGSHLLTSMFIIGETCDTYCSAQNISKQCIKECPHGLFEYKSSCVSFCNSPLYTVDNKCVETCPFDKPYIETSSITVANWSKNGVQFKKSSTNETIVKCEATCSADKVLFGSRCVDRCPLHSRFILNGTCRSETCTTNYKFYTSLGISCFDECPPDLFIKNDTCYSQCPNNMYALGRNCVSECPRSHSFVNNETLGKREYNCLDLENNVCTESLTYIMRCHEKCPGNKFIHKNTCLDFCSKNISVVFNRTCVTSCPETNPFTQPSNKTVSKRKERSIGGEWYFESEDHQVDECVRKCTGNYSLHFGYRCTSSCPSNVPYLDDETKCVKRCPGDKLLDINTSMCVNICENDRGLFNHSCYYNCPEEYKYMYNSKCVSQCPSSHANAAEEDRFICRKSCAGNCNINLGAHISLWVLVALLLILIVYSRQSLMDFLHVLRLMFVSEKKLKEIQKQENICRRMRKQKEDRIPINDEVSFQAENEEIMIELQGDRTDNVLNHEDTRL
ncbi:proprotein convertase subtilisin/kexin type 5-like [Mercenaria mercenaria]|uniref:proprotein convertase subtilisin/kexin type 5-like n=1 Tax=Mercenaria mercenaria TaxID=6596 RepID=UPI00234E6306|nr:proprotein convertase subtilisin/kexin type 5-like [Mercenaria mercenaria]